MMNSKHIPTHVAIIMDGNGRWARLRGVPKIMGHREGVKSIEMTLEACRELGVKILTLYVFSTENWSRPKKEVDGLMNLLKTELPKLTPKLKKEGIKLNIIGNVAGLPEDVQKEIRIATAQTKSNKSFILNLAVNYGARLEILEAVKNVSRDYRQGLIDIERFNESDFSGYLYTKGIPDPDLLIRTSGEMRISNFLLWQIAYSEIYVTNKLWPDFKKPDLINAITAYQSRQRRYGGS